MKSKNSTLLHLIRPAGGGERTFRVPVYQRNYQWKKDQCLTLFQDIINIAGTENNHFTGTIVYINDEEDADFRSFIVIDGQQRLTTVMLLLRAIMDSSTDDTLKKDIFENYLTNPFTPSEHLRLELKPLKEEASNFQKIMDGKTSDINDDSIVFANYRLFKKKIHDFIETEYPKIAHIDTIQANDPGKAKEAQDITNLATKYIYEGIKKLEIVYIALEKNKENPQMVFESINSTGLALEDADLIRNYLLLVNKYTEQKRLYNDYWVNLEKLLPDVLISEYIKDYLIFKNSEPLKKGVYAEFKKYHQKSNNVNTEDLLKELLAYGKYYAFFKYCNTKNKEINKRLSQLQIFKSTSTYPFLLSIFGDCYTDKTIDEEELISTLDAILLYVIRRSLSGMSSTEYGRIFAAMSRAIEAYPDLPMHEKVTTVLANIRGTSIFPNDATLRECLLTKDIYHSPYCNFILSQIEKAQKRKESADLEGCSIEHIMPQTLSDEWKSALGDNHYEIYRKYIHTIGNLTLTKYNSELSNDLFTYKKKIYEGSPIYITKSIADYTNWSENEILNRANKLIDDIINNIWKCPDIVANMNYEIDANTEFDFENEVTFKNRKPVELKLFETTYKVSSWTELLDVLCKTLYEEDPQLFRSLTRHDDFITSKHNRIISETAEKMTRPLKIAENLYIESNRDGNTILAYCRKILDKFGDKIKADASFKVKELY